VSPEELAVIGGVDAHTGNPVIPAVDFEFGANGSPPTDIAETPRHTGHHHAGILISSQQRQPISPPAIPPTVLLQPLRELMSC
jgi:hypothetical protein